MWPHIYLCIEGIYKNLNMGTHINSLNFLWGFALAF